MGYTIGPLIYWCDSLGKELNTENAQTVVRHAATVHSKRRHRPHHVRFSVTVLSSQLDSLLEAENGYRAGLSVGADLVARESLSWRPCCSWTLSSRTWRVRPPGALRSAGRLRTVGVEERLRHRRGGGVWNPWVFEEDMGSVVSLLKKTGAPSQVRSLASGQQKEQRIPESRSVQNIRQAISLFCSCTSRNPECGRFMCCQCSIFP